MCIGEKNIDVKCLLMSVIVDPKSKMAPIMAQIYLFTVEGTIFRQNIQ